ncbi:hypothetical protein THYS13_15030 [Thermoanaerobacter sp. YS13]|uniref:hypothetical protein n=1 Tax=Thermoanaerobacter sp. YS13 TaxID=1511746 RepID=UPI0005742C89|nr:hypothetical protein [Thermoanaerobacter sp. YS13]KHO63377.1 hypothetical protein THYS13_15030 [Thermoanaerobacter sp. YS13]
MKVFEKMILEVLLNKIGNKEQYKEELIDDIMAGTIRITFPDGTVEEQVPCPLFWEHVKPCIGRDRVIDEVCAEFGGCDKNDIKRCWKRYFDLEVNGNVRL